MSKRQCMQGGCNKHAVAVLAFDYKNSEVIIDSIREEKIQNTYELCADHANNFIPPKKWKLIKLQAEDFAPDKRDKRTKPLSDDIFAIASVVQGAGRSSRTTNKSLRSSAPTREKSTPNPSAEAFRQMFGPAMKFRRPEPTVSTPQSVEVAEKGNLKMYTFNDEKED